MAESGFATADQLLEGILAGQVPRQVRLFAAQGLLPVSREELLRLQLILSADPDPELAKLAGASLAEIPTQVITRWLQDDRTISPIELDLLARVREEDTVWVGVARHANVSDQTLCVLAAHGSEIIQDVIVTNQVRILDCLEILDALKVNSRATQVALRRVREFEEEFIKKAVALAGDEAVTEGTHGPSIEQALESLRAIGANIPKESYLPYPTTSDPQVEEQVKKQGLSTYGRILKMSVRDKVLCAIRGTREERGILINSRSRLVMRAVLSSPKLTEQEIEKFAASKAVSEDVIRVISENPKWVRQYPIVLALVQNPKAPIRKSLQLLSRLSSKDLNRVARDRNVNPVVRRQALGRLEHSRR
jgi:hypothetical protein